MGAVAGAGLLYQMKVKSEDGDFLICRFWDSIREIEGNDDIKVAKPYMLRRTPFDGASRVIDGTTYNFAYTDDRTRTSTNAGDGADVETYHVDPEYLEDDIIYAERAVIGGTAVVDESSPAVDVVWLDSNRCGREWVQE